jgi:hypothetical protein
MPAFRAAFSLMQVQGNQIASVCLEQKQSCMRTEQRSQLARKVPHRLCAGLRKTRRGRLCTASARRTWQAGKKLWQAALEPTRVIAEETRKAKPAAVTPSCPGKKMRPVLQSMVQPSRTGVLTKMHRFHSHSPVTVVIDESANLRGLPGLPASARNHRKPGPRILSEQSCLKPPC